MPKLGDSYSTGKGGEKDTWSYLSNLGFVRPSKEQRKSIESIFKERGIVINKRGFDVINKNWNKNDPPVLYEVKSCGSVRGKKIAEGFKGLGFTLTEAEKKNAEALRENFQFIFVNVATQKHLIVRLEEFFHSKHARIYPTWSVFIITDLSPTKRSSGN